MKIISLIFIILNFYLPILNAGILKYNTIQFKNKLPIDRLQGYKKEG